MADRPTDAGTTNQWTFAGEGKVYVWKSGLPVVLGRRDHPYTLGREHKVIAISPEANHSGVIMITPHQARALMEILPAAIALAEQEDE